MKRGSQSPVPSRAAARPQPCAVCISVACLIVLVLAGCGNAIAPTPQPGLPEVAALAETTDIVSASAIVVPFREAVLSIRASGRLEEILVSEGQEVSAGQELARVADRDLRQGLSEAEAGLQAAKASLARVKASARSQEIAAAEAALAVAEAAAKAAESAKQVAEGSLTAAEADRDAAKGGVAIARGNSAAAQATLSSAEAALSKLLAGASQLEIQIAESQVKRAKNELYALQRQRDETYNILEGQIAASEQLVQIAELQLQQLKAGARSEDIAAARAQVALAQAGVQTATGQAAQAEAQALRASANVSIAAAQVGQAQAQEESAAAQVAQAQAQLDLLRAGSRPEDIAVSEAAVAQAEAAVMAARNALEDAVLRAPFAGTIGAILAQEGELVTPQTAVIHLGDLGRLRVRTEDLGEGDVNLVRLGQPVRVTIDALPDKEFRGTVASIAPFASDRRGDKVYEVGIDIDLPGDSGLRWGMGAFVEIEVRSR
jgi:HlyD family secretion protein